MSDRLKDAILYYIPETVLETDITLRDYVEQSGVLGMKWGHRKDSYSSGKSRKKKGKKSIKLLSKLRGRKKKIDVPQESAKAIKKRLSEVNEAKREKKYIDAYKHRDKMSVKAIKDQTARLQAESAFESAVYAKQTVRAQRQAAALAEKKAKRSKQIGLLLNVAGNIPLNTLIKNPKSEDFYKNENTATDAQKKAYEEAVQGAAAIRNLLLGAQSISKTVGSSMASGKNN